MAFGDATASGPMLFFGSCVGVRCFSLVIDKYEGHGSAL
jgi:hypothetical protein